MPSPGSVSCPFPCPLPQRAPASSPLTHESLLLGLNINRAFLAQEGLCLMGSIPQRPGNVSPSLKSQHRSHFPGDPSASQATWLCVLTLEVLWLVVI